MQPPHHMKVPSVPHPPPTPVVGVWARNKQSIADHTEDLYEKRDKNFFGTKMLLYSSHLRLFDFETYNFHNTFPVITALGGCIPERRPGNQEG